MSYARMACIWYFSRFPCIPCMLNHSLLELPSAWVNPISASTFSVCTSWLNWTGTYTDICSREWVAHTTMQREFVYSLSCSTNHSWVGSYCWRSTPDSACSISALPYCTGLHQKWSQANAEVSRVRVLRSQPWYPSHVFWDAATSRWTPVCT